MFTSFSDRSFMTYSGEVDVSGENVEEESTEVDMSGDNVEISTEEIET